MRRYELATPADDATLRALLRDNTLPSWVTMSMEREPSWFAAAGRLGREWSVVAREDSIPVGMYACSEQMVHLNGVPVELGYLNSLRVGPGYRNRFALLRGGYESIRKLRPARGPELWFTSIAAENDTARRLLEANLKGMPRYSFLNELATLVVSRAHGHKRGLWRRAAAGELPRICEFYNAAVGRFNLAPWLTPESAAGTQAPFFVAERQGRLLASMALWNQQSYRQIVVRGYRQPLRALRPAYNLFARATKRVTWPRAGEVLDSACLAYFAVSDAGEGDLEALVADALSWCPTRTMLFGLHGRNPWLGRLQSKFRPECYRTRLYTVSFDGGAAVDARPAQPEVALL